MFISFLPLSLLETAHIQLQDVHFLVEQAAYIGSCPAQISMHKLFDVGAYGSVANGTGAGEDIENHVAAVYW